MKRYFLAFILAVSSIHNAALGQAAVGDLLIPVKAASGITHFVVPYNTDKLLSTAAAPIELGPNLSITAGVLDSALTVDAGDLTTGTLDTDRIAFGSIFNAHLASSTVTIGGSPLALGGTLTSLTGLTDLGVSMANDTTITGISLGTNTTTASRPLVISGGATNASYAGQMVQVKMSINGPSTSNVGILSIYGGTTGTTEMWRFRGDGVLQCMAAVGHLVSVYSVQPTAYFILGDSVYMADDGYDSPKVVVRSSGSIGFTSGVATASVDAFFKRTGAASIQMGADSSTPIAQSFGFANGSGTNITGADATIQASNGTGTGGSGKLLFKTAPTASSGSTANTLRTVLKLNADGTIDSPTMTVEAASDPASTHKLTIYVNGTRYKVLAIQE